MRKYIALIVIAAVLVTGALVEHFHIVKHFDRLITDSETLQVELLKLEDNKPAPAHVLEKAESLQKQFNKKLPVAEALASHNCLRDIKIKMAEVIAAIKVKSIKDASMQLQTVIVLLEHLNHLGTPKLQHLI